MAFKIFSIQFQNFDSLCRIMLCVNWYTLQCHQYVLHGSYLEYFMCLILSGNDVLVTNNLHVQYIVHPYFIGETYLNSTFVIIQLVSELV